MSYSACTHSAVDGAEGHEALVVVGQGATVGIPVWVLAPLQDELLALEVMVLESHPSGPMGEGEKSEMVRWVSNSGKQCLKSVHEHRTDG